jgi:hypothetical protein
MTYSTREIDGYSLPLPITQAANITAQRFSLQQPNSQKAEQVYLNTLAVYAVNDYLQLMGIPTELTAGDSWNPVMRLCTDVADLEVTGKGRLECRPVKISESTCHVPLEVQEDRIGYVLIQIDKAHGEAIILGFTKTAVTDELHISHLQPLESLLKHLSQIGEPELVNPPVQLSQWLQGIVEAGWQTIETLLNPEATALAFSFRSGGLGTKFGKLIDLGIQLAGHPVALIVTVSRESDKINVMLQVHPNNHSEYLPSNLQLIVLDESGTEFLQTQSRNADNYIQLQFWGSLGEQFSVKIALNDASITEDFVL